MPAMTFRRLMGGFGWISAISLSTALFSVSCSDDDAGDGVDGGSGGASAGNGGSAGSGGGAGSSAGGSGGSAMTGAGGNSNAGSGGSAGMGGTGGGSSDVDAGPDSGDAGVLAFTLSSPAFDGNPGCGPGGAAAACDLFPVENTGLGDGTNNVSPELNWVGTPPGTESFAIALHDLVYMPQGEPFTHWVLWNIPVSETGLPPNLPRGLEPGVPSDDTGQVSYLDDNGFAGSGACGNVYEFVLFALSTPSFEPTNDDPDDVEDELAASDDVLETTTLRARSSPAPAGPCNN
jgi:phosphatidylethanolamine-binding protein (PEBP) family uncharacterized protein